METLIDFENYNYYLTPNGAIVTVESEGYSYSYEDEEADCFTGSPFKTKSYKDLGWESIEKEEDFPKWFLGRMSV